MVTSENRCTPRLGMAVMAVVFLIYIKDLSNNIISKVKLFTDDTSISSVVYNSYISMSELNNEFKTKSFWA